MKRIGALVAVLAFAAVATLTTGAATSAKVLNVKLVEFKVLPAAKVAPAGKVTFVVRNAGKITHELVVIKTAKPAGKLLKGSKADESGRLGKIGDLKPGQARKLTLTLKKGHYALICNLPGHYAAGQYTDFTAR